MKKGNERRDQIMQMLEAKRGKKEPISATYMGNQTGVSRQIVVGDIARLRAAGVPIVATPRGYYLRTEGEACKPLYRIVCNHGADQMCEELNTVVDFGGTVEEVIVEHPIYGKLTGELKISCRYDVDAFAKKVMEADALPLSALTEGVHMHTVSFADEQAYLRFREALSEKGILIE